MTRPHLFRPVALAFLGLTPFAHAQTSAPATPAAAPSAEASADIPADAQAAGKSEEISGNEMAALLRQLRQMRAGLDSEERKAAANAIAALNSACSGTTGAMNLWVDSVRVVEFDRQSKKQTDFEDWRKKNDDKMHDAAFCAALLLQCRYLKLCLESDTPEKQAKAFPVIQTLMEEAVAAIPKTLNYSGMLREDVFGTVIAKRLGIEKMCPEGWSRGLLRPDEQFGRAIKAARKGDAQALLSLWASRIKLERAIAKANDDAGKIRRRKEARTQFGNRKDSRDAKEMEEQDTKSEKSFEKDHLPKLQWAMGEDLYKAGMHRRGIETMFTVITKNPRHPSVSDWVNRITAIAEELSGQGATETAQQ